ncbi:hypothetical protein V6N13_035765 [Hibiscus sabdariffa]|uniref:Uncharacterized protein n=1 Tax=Hibiscus sabdariffa TaxID=183260 RepID=A0ABR2S8H2_9ROSI
MGDNVSKNRRRHDGDDEGTENGEQPSSTLFVREPTAADVAVAALAVGLVVCGVIFLGSRGKKTMKAPEGAIGFSGTTSNMTPLAIFVICAGVDEEDQCHESVLFYVF